MALDRLLDYDRFKRIDLTGDLAGTDTFRPRLNSETGELGYVLSMGYYYSASYASWITSSTPNTHFIHAAFDSSATSGDNRGLYLITRFSGAGTGGEAVRIRSRMTALSTSAVRALSVENRAIASSGCSGTVDGIYSALVAESTATVTGTWAAMHLESQFVNGATPTNAAFIRLSDNSATYCMPYFLNFDAAATCIVADTSNVPAAATHKIKCKVAGTDFYLIGVADF